MSKRGDKGATAVTAALRSQAATWRWQHGYCLVNNECYLFSTHVRDLAVYTESVKNLRQYHSNSRAQGSPEMLGEVLLVGHADTSGGDSMPSRVQSAAMHSGLRRWFDREVQRGHAQQESWPETGVLFRKVGRQQDTTAAAPAAQGTMRWPVNLSFHLPAWCTLTRMHGCTTALSGWGG